MKKCFLIILYIVIVFGVKAQSVSYQQAKSYADSGNYIEAIRVMKIVAEKERNSEYYIDDITTIARYYSYTNEVDSLIQYNNLAQQLAEKLFWSNDSIAEIYIQSVAWNYDEGGQYEAFVNTAERVLELRDSVYGPSSKESFEWIGVMSFKAFKTLDIHKMVEYCDVEEKRAEEYYGINSPYYEKAISSIRGYADALVDKLPEFTTHWVKPYYQKIKDLNILPQNQYEFEILQLAGFLTLNNLKSADYYASELEKWTYESNDYTVPLGDKVRILLKLAMYRLRTGDIYKARYLVDASWNLLKEANVAPSLEQLIDRHNVEKELKMDSLGNYRMNAQWLINTATPIIEARKEDSSTIAFFYESRAWAYQDLQNYDKAISDMKSAIELNPLDSRKKKLAQIYMSKGDYVSAEKQFLDIYDSSDVSSLVKKSVVSDLSSLYWLLGKKEKLCNLLYDDFINQKSDIRNAFAFMNEYERESFLEERTLVGGTILFDMYTSFSNGLAQWDVGNGLAYNLSLVQKGLLQSTTKDIDSFLKSAPDSIQEKYKRYKQLHDLFDMPNMRVESPETKKLRIDLMKYVTSQPNFLSQLDVIWQDVYNSLSDREVAIEFINLYGIHPNNMEDPNPAIGALVLSKGFSAPIFVYLTDVASIDSLYEYGDKGERFDDVIYSGNAKVQLYEKIWKPLEPYLNNIRTVYYSPTGVLQNINVDCIGKDESELLSDRYELYRLSSTREICNKKTMKQFKEATLYGDISYSINVPVINENPASKFRSTSRFGFGPLNETAIEVDSINSQFNIHKIKNKTFTKTAATEESFRKLSGVAPSILHIATHGFYYTNDEIAQQGYRNNFISFQLGEPELYRSGLALSGAQDSWCVNDIQKYLALDQNHDGILLAAEIAQIDLRGLDLVVLSACETALGKVKPEGVYGLQRAFKLAGAKSIIMSLWKVDDYATQILMTSFYRNYLNGMSMREALLMSQKVLRETPGFENPYYWAAFILLDGLN